MDSEKEPNLKQIAQSLKQKKRKLMDKVFLQKAEEGIASFSLFLEKIWELDKKILAKYLNSKKTREMIADYQENINPRMMIIINKYSSLDETDPRKRKRSETINSDQDYFQS